MWKWFRWVLLGIIIIALGIGYYFFKIVDRRIVDFETCAKKYPVMETYPAQCRTKDGRTFTEVILPNPSLSSQIYQWQSCQADSDCVETQKDCCGCQEGGVQIAINKNYLDLWNKEIADKCGNTTCPQVYLCQEGVNVCNSNKICEFKIKQ